MKRIDLSRDVIPVSDLRKRTASVLDAVQRGGRPMLITQNGRGAAVLLPVDVYERLLDDHDLRAAIAKARDQAAAGQTVAHEDFAREIQERYSLGND